MSRALILLGGLGALALLASRSRGEQAAPGATTPPLPPTTEPPLPGPSFPAETEDPQEPAAPLPPPPPQPPLDGERGDPECGGQRPVADPVIEEALQRVPAPHRCTLRTQIAEGGHAWRGAAETLAISLEFAGQREAAEAIRAAARSGTGYVPPVAGDPECGGQDLIPGAEHILAELPMSWRCHARDLILGSPTWRTELEQLATNAESLGLAGLAAQLRQLIELDRSSA